MPMYFTAPRVALGLLAMATAIQCGPADSGNAQQANAADAIPVVFDYAGAEALMAAIERDSLTIADVDSLLRIHGVRAMVDNVTRFVPQMGEPEFRRAIQSFARTKRRSYLDRYFQLDDAWRGRRQVRSLIGKIRKSEPAILRQLAAKLTPYQPRTDRFAITAYFVAGGVSDGFVPDDTNAANYYANLVRANGDYDDVVSNVAHETYHVMQKAAQRRTPGLAAVADSVESLPGPERLLATTLAEGTASYVVDPTHKYKPARVRENFAVFDTVLAGLQRGDLTWDRAYVRGFTNSEDERFYVLGFEMAKAIERYCGRACIGRSFERAPIDFFREYVRLYREHPDLIDRFSAPTEAFLGAPVRTGT